MRFAVGLLTVAGAACVAGMVIPQGEPLAVYQKAYGYFIASVLYTGGLTDVYRSWWFVLILSVMCLSVLVCTVRRCVFMWRSSASPRTSAQEIARARHQAEWRSLRSTGEMAEAASSALSRFRYKVRTFPDPDGSLFVLGRKGALGEWGGVLMHASLVLVLVGAAYGHMPEIRLGDRVLLRSGNIDSVRHVVEGEKFRPPGADFQVRLARLRVPVDDLGRPKQYLSDLQIIEDGKVVARPTISVNYPYSRDGLSLYQTEWSLRGFVLKMTAPDGRSERVIVPVRPEGYNMMDSLARLEIPKWIVFAHEFFPDAVEKDGAVVSRSNFPGSPAAMVFVDRRGTLKPPWEFHKGRVGWVRAGRDTCFAGHCFRIERLIVTSGIGVRKEPGLLAVWIGFVALCLGVCAVFIVPASAVAAHVRPGPGGSSVTAAVSGGAGADPERQVQAFREALKDE